MGSLRQVNYSFKQYGKTHLSSFSPTVSTCPCPSGLCDIASLWAILGLHRSKDKTKVKVIRQLVLLTERSGNPSPANPFYHFPLVPTFAPSFQVSESFSTLG